MCSSRKLRTEVQAWWNPRTLERLMTPVVDGINHMRIFIYAKPVRLSPPLLPWFCCVSGFIVCMFNNWYNEEIKIKLKHFSFTYC